MDWWCVGICQARLLLPALNRPRVLTTASTAPTFKQPRTPHQHVRKAGELGPRQREALGRGRPQQEKQEAQQQGAKHHRLQLPLKSDDDVGAGGGPPPPPFPWSEAHRLWRLPPLLDVRDGDSNSLCLSGKGQCGFYQHPKPSNQRTCRVVRSAVTTPRPRFCSYRTGMPRSKRRAKQEAVTDQVDADAALSLFPCLCEPAQSFSHIADPWRHNLRALYPPLQWLLLVLSLKISRVRCFLRIVRRAQLFGALGPHWHAHAHAHIMDTANPTQPNPTQTPYKLCKNLIVDLGGIPPGDPKSLLDIPTHFTGSRLPGNKS